MLEQVNQWILLLHAASSLFMVGLIWFVQIVHYPLLATVDANSFSTYEKRHMALISYVVIPPMLLEAATAIALFWFRPPIISIWLVGLTGTLLAIIWLSTFLLQVPCHDKLAQGFDPVIHRRLVLTNWIRTWGWTIRGILVLGMMEWA